MARFYSIDDANAALPDVERILLDLRDQRTELIRLRDAVIETSGGERGTADRTGRPSGSVAEAGIQADDRRRLRLRMQGLIDQMQAGVTRLVERDVTLREIEAGLIDFPALVNGRQVWLCWRLGEGDIAWWHELGDGFGGRVALADLT
ncbi:MAG: DUF2203 domain-containing protein [Chloroflexi bacterium]|nr:DUF2203 domain-containing protein [Chloroflexota bacterium]